jgi:hypothetical protein
VIAITAAEKEAIRAKYPDVHMVRTMKQDSKRHHYYMVESGGPMRLLKSLRGQDKPGQKGRDGRR